MHISYYLYLKNVLGNLCKLYYSNLGIISIRIKLVRSTLTHIYWIHEPIVSVMRSPLLSFHHRLNAGQNSCIMYTSHKIEQVIYLRAAQRGRSLPEIVSVRCIVGQRDGCGGGGVH